MSQFSHFEVKRLRSLFDQFAEEVYAEMKQMKIISQAPSEVMMNMIKAKPRRRFSILSSNAGSLMEINSGADNAVDKRTRKLILKERLSVRSLLFVLVI
jgi:predicted CopG family antitoxin